MKNIIVTGGTGFIGRNLSNRLSEIVGNTGRVISLGSNTVDLTNRNATFDWFDKLHWSFECDHIFHLAAVYKAGGWPMSHPATQLFSNTSININVLEAWSRFFPKAKLTSVMSYCMYPPHDAPHPETELWGTEPESYLYSYALTKKILLTGHKAYQQEHDLSCTSVILPTVYGPGDKFSEDSHVMSALIGKFVHAYDCGLESVEVWGDGSQEREFLYIDDAVDGIINVARTTNELVHNLGTSKAEKIRTIANIIKSKSGYTGNILYNKDKFVGVRKRALDTTLIEKNLNWKAQTSTEEGIEKTINWYKENRL